MTIEQRDSLTDVQVVGLHELYGSWWWTEDRDLDDVRQMLDQSDECIALVDTESESLIGFARLLTDYTYKALIFDVIVAESHQGRGLGRDLIDAILTHSALEAVDHFELYCVSEMVPFYERWGFTDELDDLRLMRRNQ